MRQGGGGVLGEAEKRHDNQLITRPSKYKWVVSNKKPIIFRALKPHTNECNLTFSRWNNYSSRISSIQYPFWGIELPPKGQIAVLRRSIFRNFLGVLDSSRISNYFLRDMPPQPSTGSLLWRSQNRRKTSLVHLSWKSDYGLERVKTKLKHFLIFQRNRESVDQAGSNRHIDILPTAIIYTILGFSASKTV